MSDVRIMCPSVNRPEIGSDMPMRVSLAPAVPVLSRPATKRSAVITFYERFKLPTTHIQTRVRKVSDAQQQTGLLRVCLRIPRRDWRWRHVVGNNIN